MKWIKINKDIYYVKSVSLQLGINNNSVTIVTIENSSNNDYEEKLFKIYENKETFKFSTKSYESKNQLLKL